ncbi:MAG TPA: class I SAM-dependent methyltransferase [Pyrinomonadaceae bacterium]|nr:class I SAM-dependent methyltransferase [Pyrinomonadaceae bacterium]
MERLPPTRAEITAIYDRKARHWSAILRRLGYDQAYRNLIHRLVQSRDLSYLHHGGRVLDCGIGTGALSLALLEALPFKFHLTGLDLSPRMIEEAKRRLTPASAGFDLYCQDVSSLPLGGEKFDLVMCGHLLEHLPDPLDGMRRMAEGLRPGALLLAIVTRPGRLGSLIHLQYRNQCIHPGSLVRGMKQIGLTNIRLLQLDACPVWCRWLSYACVAAKPGG